ncbi:MAG: hypothetical protein K6A78_01695 [Prevotella sp.]|nr:hypothetical protein [Prevotella sp.]
MLALSENYLTVFPNVSSANNITYTLTNENHDAFEITEDGVIPLEEYKTVIVIMPQTTERNYLSLLTAANGSMCSLT